MLKCYFLLSYWFIQGGIIYQLNQQLNQREVLMKISSIGITAGSIALLLALFSFWAGPFSPQPTVENIVAEKVSSIRTAAIDALKGKKVEKKFIDTSWDADKLIQVITAMLGGLALILGVIAYTKSEPRRMAGGAVALGVSAISFQFVAMYAMALLLVLLIAAALQSVGLDL